MVPTTTLPRARSIPNGTVAEQLRRGGPIDPPTAWEDFGPEEARAALASMVKNRRLRPERVNQLADDLLAGRYRTSSRTIGFDVDGHLIDGQHLSHAVIKSDRTVRVLVVRGLPTDVQEVIDIGAPRTAGDQIHLHGQSNGRELAAVAAAVIRWREDDSPKRTVIRGKWSATTSVPAVLEAIDRDPRIIRATKAALVLRQSIRVRPRVSGLAWWLFVKSGSVTLADDFFAQLASGECLLAGDPIYALRERLLAETRAIRRINDGDLLALFIRGWNAWREDRQISKVQAPRDGDDYPEPV